MDIPSKFVLPESGVDIGFSAARLSGEIWQVYADRSGVPTTSKPGKGDSIAMLSYLQPLYVLEDAGDYLHVISDPAISPVGGFSVQAQDLGWVAKSQTLLWTHCLVKPGAHNQNVKVLTINTLKSLKEEVDPFEHLKGDSLICYLDPGLTQIAGRKLPMFDLYFLYKQDSSVRKEGGAMLLGAEIRGRHTEQLQRTIVGWVPAERLVIWDQPLALEPNTDTEAWEEREAEETPIQVFAAEEAAGRFQRGLHPIPGSIWWNADPGNQRPLGPWWRFPVLGEKDGILKLGLLGSLPEAKDTLPNSGDRELDEAALAKAMVEDAREIHLLFVIGASESFLPKLSQMTATIQNLLLELSSSDLGVASLRYGAVVYRDYSADHKTAEIQPMTRRPIQLLDFLNRQLKQAHLGNPDPPAAMYHGLKAALEATGTQPEHSQLVILLGDVGNHDREDPSLVKADDVIQLLMEHQCNVFACQMLNPGTHDTYEQFPSQLKLLLKMSAIQLYQRFKKDSSQQVYYPKLQEIGPQTVSIENGMTEAILLSAAAGSQQNMDSVQQQITKLVIDMVAQVNEQWGAIPVQDLSASPIQPVIVPNSEVAAQPKLAESVQSQEKLKDSLLASPFVNFLTPSAATYVMKERHLSPQQLQQITQSHYPMYLAGFAPKKITGQQHRLFRYVRLYSREELSDLIRELSSLAKAADNGNPRANLHALWKGLLSAHTGYISPEDANRLRFQEAGELVFGMPETHKMFAGKRLGDLLNRRTIKDTEIQQYLRSIRDSLRELQRIFNANEYPYLFESVNRSYYCGFEKIHFPEPSGIRSPARISKARSFSGGGSGQT